MTYTIVKKMLWTILALLVIVSTLVFFTEKDSHAATPEGNFDLWISEVHTYLDDLLKGAVAKEWGAAGWSEAVEVELASQRARVRTSTSTISNTSGATGECGGATNGADQFIGKESGGNASVYNSGGSGAWGCYQIMPGTWASSCGPDNKLDLPAVGGGYGGASGAQQAECASRLPLSAWR